MRNRNSILKKHVQILTCSRTHLLFFESLLGVAGGNWNSIWRHSHQLQPFWGACSTTWTLVLTSVILESSLQLSTGTCPALQPVSTSVETSQAKQLVVMRHSPTYQEASCLTAPEPTAALEPNQQDHALTIAGDPQLGKPKYLKQPWGPGPTQQLANTRTPGLISAR